MFPAPIETDALVLRRFAESTVDVFELYASFAADREDVDAVFEYVPQEPYSVPAEAREQLLEAESEWDDAESAQYAVFTEGGSFAGYTGLFPEWDRRMARIGFILARPYWGRGYARACAAALTDLAFDDLDLEVVAFDHAVGHDRSRAVIEGFVADVGGQYDGRLRNWRVIDGEPVDHRRYTVTREQYRRSSPTEQ